ncbi:MAG: shikimate dehydrogenase [Leeuwenhoekiella sp.]
MRKFGLIGRNIDYSFSRKYFNNKFKTESIEAHYVNFDCATVEAVSRLFEEKSDVSGFNVTIPYKEEVLPFLQRLSDEALEIGAVNTIKHEKDGSFTGHNTDYLGFMESIKPFLKDHHKDALILGTGGASKAVEYALKKSGIATTFISRKPKTENILSYGELSAEIMAKNTVIINTTPLGTFPDVQRSPNLPYAHLSKKHLLYDLVYNPAETQFLKKGKEQGAATANGTTMLKLQAEAAWKIWDS